MDKSLRNSLRIVVKQSRKILEEAIGELLQGQFGIHASGKIEDADSMIHLSEKERLHREQLLVHLEHIQATGFKLKDAVAQLVREIAFTHLNRLCAYKMMETRHLIREAVSRGVKSNGFIFYLADHAEDERLWSSGKQDIAYRHFLVWLGETLSEEIGVLFSPHDSASRLFPPYHVLERVLDLLNDEELKDIWSEDETIGWVYQYFTPKELRDQVRKESQAPRNSYELAFRNQFYTPRYVVQFLTDNTLGRSWYEMRQGNTRLKEQCAYLVRRPDEVFLAKADSPEVEQAQCWLQGEDVPEPDLWPLAHTVNGYERAGEFGEETSRWMQERRTRLTPDGTQGLKTQELLDLLFLFCRYERFNEGMLDSLSSEIAVIRDILRERVRPSDKENRSQEELLRAPFFILYRPKKDPREIRILDPACGSGHFLLYCFGLLETIYEEAYKDPELGPNLQKDYATLAELKKAVPGLILTYNLHGIDIDLRATQIAALALWLRAQRTYRALNIKDAERPKITRSNIVCAEPMPGEKDMLEEFIKGLQPMILGNLVRTIFEKMQLASEAGSLLKIEEEIKEAVIEAKQRWSLRPKGEQLALWPEQASASAAQPSLFEGITNKEFWNGAEARVIDELYRYTQSVSNGRVLARQLFADDAVQGFAFIDICQKRFDVVLMNPPFGKCSLQGQEYFDLKYADFKNDIGIAFVDRWLSALNTGGVVGAITSRTFIASDSLTDWRNEVLLYSNPLQYLLDLGYGVLDEAMVEAAAYIVAATSQETSRSLFIRLLEVQDKAIAITNYFEENVVSEGFFLFEHGLEEFRKVPLSVICYWLPVDLLEKIIKRPKLILSGGAARHGLVTTDDFRFIRSTWEIPIDSLGREKRWIFLAKGGEYQPYWDDIHLVIDWGLDGENLKSFLAAKRFATQGSADWSPWINHHEFYFMHGLTYPERTTSDFCTRVLPMDIVFSSSGQAIQFERDELAFAYLGGTFTRIFRLIVESFVGSGDNSVSGSAAKHYRSGLLNVLPMPLTSLSKEYMSAVIGSINYFRQQADMDETTRFFQFPTIDGTSLRTIAIRQLQTQLEGALAVLVWNRKIELEVEAAFGVIGEDRKIIRQLVGEHPLEYSLDTSIDLVKLVELWESQLETLVALGVTMAGARRQITKKSYIADRRLELICHILGIAPERIVTSIIENNLISREMLVEVTKSVLSYALGTSFARWDIRIAQDSSLAPLNPTLFDPLPACPPGMLIGPNGLPATSGHIVNEEWLLARPDAITLPPEGMVKKVTIPNEQYPIKVNWEGILVDDPDHPDDIVNRMQDVLRAIWQERAGPIEQEACRISGSQGIARVFPQAGQWWLLDGSCQALFQESPQSAHLLAAPSLQKRTMPSGSTITGWIKILFSRH